MNYYPSIFTRVTLWMCAQSLTRVWLFETPWNIAYEVPLSMGFSRQEYWSGLLFTPPGNLPDPRIEPKSPALAGGFFTSEQPGKPWFVDSLPTQVPSLCPEDPLKEEMTTHFSILAWEILWTEEPCGLQPMVTQKSPTWLEWLSMQAPYIVQLQVFQLF